MCKMYMVAALRLPHPTLHPMPATKPRAGSNTKPWLVAHQSNF